MTRPDNVPTTLEAMIADGLEGACTEYCITNVDDDDPSMSDHVILGKPTEELADEIVVSIHMQHPFGPTMDKDSAITGKTGVTGFHFPDETIGGGRVDQIMGAVQVNIRQDLEYADAMWISAVVVERVKQAINLHPDVRSLTDSYGNVMFKLQTFRAIGYASGGGDVSVYFRWVDFVAYVSYTNC